MTIENDIDLLVSDVATRKAAVVKAKGDLDAIVAEGASAAGQAESAALAALSAREEVLAMATASGALATASVGATAYADLAAVAAAKVEDAVGVFIYDTSFDSDGGAWRYRTKGTSWYREALNTATRGSRREFPAVAVIVADARKVTIYDGDDPSLPMWMVFELNGIANGSDFRNTGVGVHNYAGYPFSITSVQMLNGRLVFTMSKTGVIIEFGMWDVNLLSEVSEIHLRYPSTATGQGVYRSFGNIAQRNSTQIVDTGTKYSGGSARGIIGGNGNDVAMTVLPDAPIDPATGLPVPTIAVATDGGVSVIKHDGTVVDITGSSGAAYSVSGKIEFLGSDLAFGMDAGRTYSRGHYRIAIPDADRTVSSGSNTPTDKDFGRDVTGLPVPLSTNLGNGPLRGPNGTFYSPSYPYGVTLTSPNEVDRTKAMVAYTTTDYATGWMPGAIKGAWLADADECDLDSASDLVDDLIVDGHEITGATTPWREVISLADVTSGILTILHDHATSPSGRVVDLRNTIKAGYTYDISWVVSGFVGDAIGSSISIGGDANGNGGVSTGMKLGTGAFNVKLTATATGTIALYAQGGTPTGAVAGTQFSYFSIKERVPDRSVNANGLIVNGRVRRAPVADSAELMAYSGFSPENYLEQPYNAALDFGTGDFAVMGWVKPDATAARTFISYEGDEGWQLDNYGGSLRFWEYTPESGGNKNLATTAASTALQFACVTVVGRIVSMYVNGALVATGSTTLRSFQNGVLRIGRANSFLGYSAWGSQLALWRITGTPPSADQIARIYNDERALFEPGAACTLYGDSDAVTALAHDKVTNLLHVGTAAGRSVFDGLRRVAHTTSPVGNAIAAHDGLIIED